MGIPAFFRQIIEKYPKTHVPKLVEKIDYLFIDFNCIIYDAYYEIDKAEINTTILKFENYLISQVIKKLNNIIDNVKPQTMIYVAMDGTAPRAKMIQQRWRRYKGIKSTEYFNKLKEKYGIKKDQIDWSASANISPGTKFMKKMSIALKRKINRKNVNIVISDSNVPGEGEHKFMPIIRSMKNKQDSVCIYSPDADLIVLSMATHKNNIWILRKVRKGSDATEIEKDYILNGHEYLYLSIDEYRNGFVEQLGINGKINKVRIITDYVFLTFLGGNDFVMPMPYLKIKEEKRGVNIGGLNILLNIYARIFTMEGNYLIYMRNGSYCVNMRFMRNIFEDIVKSEDYYMRGIQMKINAVREGKGDEIKLENEKGKTEYEVERIKYEHYEYYSKLHPEYNKYKDIYEKIDFMKPKHEWKGIYYQHFFNLDPKNYSEYNSYRTRICINYLESLVFTLKYYFEGVPSWTWYYRYRAPPVASDLLTNLEKFLPNMNVIQFDMGKPYKPFDQLMMILPQQMGILLPKKYRDLMKGELLEYYPIGFEMDVFLGGKYIYAEPILPYINDKKIVAETRKITLTKEEKGRNEIIDTPYIR